MKYLTTLIKILGVAAATLLILITLLVTGFYLAGKSLIETIVNLSNDLELQIDDLSLHWNNGRVEVALDGISLTDTHNNHVPSILKASTIRGTIGFKRLLKGQLFITRIYINDANIYLEQSLRDHFNSRTTHANHRMFPTIIIGSININHATLTLAGWLEATGHSTHTLMINTATFSETMHRATRNIAAHGAINGHDFTIKGSMHAWFRFITNQAPLGIDVDANLPFLTAQVSGKIGPDHINTQLAVALEADHVNKLSQLLGQPIPRVEHVTFHTRLTGDKQQLDSNDLRLAVTGQNLAITVEGAIDDIFGQPMPILTITAGINDLATVLAPLPKAWRPPWQGNLHLSGKLSATDQQFLWTDFDFSFITSNFEYLAQSNQWALNRDLSTLMPITIESSNLAWDLIDNNGQWRYAYHVDHATIDKNEQDTILLASHGTYKKLPIKLDGQWHSDNTFTLSAIIEPMTLQVAGNYRAGVTAFDATANTSSLDPLTQLLEQAAVEVNHASLTTSVTVQNDIITVQPFAITLTTPNQDTISISGTIDNLVTMSDYHMNLIADSQRLSTLQQWLSANIGPVESNLNAMGDYRSWGSVVRLATPPKHPIDHWLQDSIDGLSLERWLNLLPAFDGKTHVAFSVSAAEAITALVFHSATIDAPYANARWQGSITNIGDDETMRVQGTIDLQADAKAHVLYGSLGAVSGHADLTTEHNLLQINPITITSDKSQFNGSAQMVLSGDAIEHATAFLTVDYLDIRPFISDTQSIGDPTTPHEKEKKSLMNTLFSDQSFDKNWLNSYDYKILLKIDRLETPWLGLDHLAAEIEQKDTTIAVNSATAIIDDSPVSSTLALNLSTQNPSLLATLVGKNINPKSFYALDNQDMLQSGSIDANVSMIGHGNNMKAVMKTLEGHVTFTSVDTVLRGTDLGKISPELSNTLMQRLNPHYKKQKNTKIECAYAHFDVDSGHMLADRSILVITPDISFTATGVIDLSKETLRIQIIPRNRKGLGLSLRGTFAKMAVITGPLDDPQVTFDPPQALLTSATNVAGTVFYGPLYWLISGQAQRLLASTNQCKARIKEANKAIYLENSTN